MQDDNPILVRMHRSDAVESLHRGAWALVRSDGSLVASAGNPSQVVFARSSSKSFQALPLIESGAADAFGLDADHIAVTLASHNGEEQHTAAVASLLEHAGLDESSLGCGIGAPALARDGWEKTQIRHNCSGKHAGFLAVACHLGQDPATYLDPEGETQQLVRNAVADMTGCDELGVAIDGCGAPTFRAPLSAWATAIARMANPEALAPDRAEACMRLTEAAALHPALVAGTGRLDSAMLRVTGGRVFPKIGAEAVYVAGIAGSDLGLAIKIDDGKADIARTVAVSLLRMIDAISTEEADQLDEWGSLAIVNSADTTVGRIELTEEAISPAL